MGIVDKSCVMWGMRIYIFCIEEGSGILGVDVGGFFVVGRGGGDGLD